MANTYCTHCGFKNEYSIHPPKFCGGCGKEMGLASKAASSSLGFIKPKNRSSMQDHEDGEEFSDINHVPNIRKLDCDIDYGSSARTLKGGDILNQVMQNQERGEKD